MKSTLEPEPIVDARAGEPRGRGAELVDQSAFARLGALMTDGAKVDRHRKDKGATLRRLDRPSEARVVARGRLLSLVAVAALACSIAANGSGGRLAAAPTLVVDNSFLLDTSDPQRAFDPTSYIVDRAVYDTLFTYAKNDLARPIPLLVKSWSSIGAKRFTFRLRRDVHFADGTPLTSADVVFSLRRLVNLKGNPSHILVGFRVSATDKYAVLIESSIPAPQLPAILTSPSAGIVNSRLVRAHGGTDSADASRSHKAESWFDSSASAGAGSGPYEIDSYLPQSQVVLRPNTSYWGSRKPAFDRVVFRNMSAPAQVLNIRRGAHQIALDLSADQAQALKGDRRLHVSLQPSPWVFYLFTHDDPRVSQVTSNKRFQAAVRHALDYEVILVPSRGTVPSRPPESSHR